MKIETTLDDILKNKLSKGSATSPDTYEAYLRKKGASSKSGYSNAVANLYASTRKDLSSYGANKRKLDNYGLQNSGYATYIDDFANKKFERGLAEIKQNYAQKDIEDSLGYAEYLTDYQNKQNSLKKSVMSHLVNNGVVDLTTAIAYGISAGLSQEDAENVGRSAYGVAKQKVFNTILEDTVRLGLDKEGARLLAVKMGVSDEDARGFAEEISALLDYYGDISNDYLEFLEQRANQK